jgi:hypothetical protein
MVVVSKHIYSYDSVLTRRHKRQSMIISGGAPILNHFLSLTIHVVAQVCLEVIFSFWDDGNGSKISVASCSSKLNKITVDTLILQHSK